MRLQPSAEWKVNEPPKKCYDDRFVTEADFKRIGSQLLSKTQHPYDISEGDMVYYFGATPFVLVRLWKDLVVKTKLPKTSKPIHLLWWMAYVKNYPTRRSFAKFTKVSATTLRKWIKKIARRMIVLLPHVVCVSFISLFLYVFDSVSFHKFSYITLYCVLYHCTNRLNGKIVFGMTNIEHVKHTTTVLTVAFKHKKRRMVNLIKVLVVTNLLRSPDYDMVYQLAFKQEILLVYLVHSLPDLGQIVEFTNITWFQNYCQTRWLR